MSALPVKKDWLKQHGQGQGPWGWPGNEVAPNNMRVDEQTRFRGTVTYYSKMRGYGFLEMAQKGLALDDKVFAHWKSIRTQDRFPSLSTGMEVEFNIMRESSSRAGQRGVSLRARDITLPGGVEIAIQDESDAASKTFVGGQYLRYTGTLKFFDPRRGFGYVKMDEGYAVSKDVPQELMVERSEVNAAGDQPPEMEDVQVEFGIWQTPKGQYKAYNMTLLGGMSFTREMADGRHQIENTKPLAGKVQMLSWKGGWGFINPDLPAELPPTVASKLKEMEEAAVRRGKKYSNENLLYFRKEDVQSGLQLLEGMTVYFDVYTDHKGSGACNVRI